MKHRLTRRSLLKKTAILAGVAAGAQLARGPLVLAGGSPNAKLGVVLIGCGGRGTGAHLPNLVRERLLAVVDPDKGQSAKALKYIQSNAEKFQLKDLDLSKVKVFTDYRRMFDEFAGQFDAVSIATPDHQHALPCMMAIARG